MAAENRSNQTLKIYNKTGKLIVTGEKGKGTATITGLAAGTKVAEGDYQASFSDGTNESDKVPVPTFNVLPSEG
ncbi:hypothetical protein NE293_01755 [Latilactobacillus curvatus]|uniref:hypothetical protein n=1 Tax=Latilactobacillus curvatus TaxID=28038 RepID=UPI002073598C|nr:hypothetical protein [Latilactobacillus curvatus]MCM6843407.1 hypothetical protein [Latilactobacillus curvatus]MCM6861741.1 hypothetical protein [Latilactobacillus curvatus]MCM6869008.1 hypothetical protein [Latilactobacillus curvatus]